VETVRTRGARLAATAGAAVVAGGTAAWIATGAGGWGGPLAVPGALAFLLVVTRAPGAVAWAPALLGAEYAAAVAIAGHARVDGRAAAVAAALVAVAELVCWARELELGVPHEHGLLGRRALRIGLTTIGAAALASVVLMFGAAPLDLGLAGDALGVAAAVAALGLVAGLARP
jgi:hypothetical protein